LAAALLAVACASAPKVDYYGAYPPVEPVPNGVDHGCVDIRAAAEKAIKEDPCGVEQFEAEARYHRKCVQDHPRDQELVADHEAIHGALAGNVEKCASDPIVDAWHLKCELAANTHAEKYLGTFPGCDELYAIDVSLGNILLICEHVKFSLTRAADVRLQSLYGNLMTAAMEAKRRCDRDREVVE
jgi:hypothetical protein